MAVIPLDMGAFPALVRPLRDHIRRFGNRSVLCDLVRVFVSVVWLPVSAILDEYQAREDDNGRKRPECSFEYAGPSGLGVGFVGVEDCKNEDGRGTDNEEWRDQHDDVGYYLSISLLLPRLPSNANRPHQDLDRHYQVQCSICYVNLAITVRSLQNFRINLTDIYLAPKQYLGIDIQHSVRQSEKRQGGNRQMVGAFPPQIARRVTTDPLIAVFCDMVDHRYQTNHCRVV